MTAISGIICRQCGGAAPRTGPGQKFCAPCSDNRHRERQAAYSRTDKPKQRKILHASRVTSEARQAGIDRSKARAETLISVDMRRPLQPALWYVRFSIPYDRAVSKNHIYGTWGPSGHLVKRRESAALQEAIAHQTKTSTLGRPVYQNKVWLEIFVQKPTGKSDAVNVVDLVCDGVKEGLGIDDRWFSIARLDWEIVKFEPKIFIAIFQEDAEPVQACSYCGDLLPFDQFDANASNKLGIGRRCRPCVREGRSRLRDATHAGAVA